MFLYWVAMGYPVITCVELGKNCTIVPKMPCAVWQNIILKAWIFRHYCLHVQIAFLHSSVSSVFRKRFRLVCWLPLPLAFFSPPQTTYKRTHRIFECFSSVLKCSLTRKKDLLYSIMVNFSIICLVLRVNFFNSSAVFRNGASLCSLVHWKLRFSITRLHQVVDKTIIITFSVCDIL